MAAQAVGLFDSGVGGLTVAREVWHQLPHLSSLYFADTAHVPYGEHSPAELISYADYITEFLISRGAHVIIDACNSTSSVALGYLQQKYGVPVVGVVEPGAELAAGITRNGRIGIIATRATIEAHAHRRELARRDGHLQVFEQACPALVPLVEKGQVDGPEVRRYLEQYLAPLQAAMIDTLILGCTHYPFLAGPIKQVLGDDVALVDPAAGTVSAVGKIMPCILAPPANPGPEYRFYVSGSAQDFSTVARLLLPGLDLINLQQVSPPPSHSTCIVVN